MRSDIKNKALLPMKKIYLILIITSTVLVGCSGSSDREKELEIREREIALKEKELGIDNDEEIEVPVVVQKTEAELRQELLQKECQKATQYLSASCTSSPKYKNLISMSVIGLELSGTISNKATLATFKNLKAKAVFSSKTGAVILTEIFNIYEFVEPSSSKKYNYEFDITNQEFKDFSSFTIDIISADCN